MQVSLLFFLLFSMDGQERFNCRGTWKKRELNEHERQKSSLIQILPWMSRFVRIKMLIFRRKRGRNSNKVMKREKKRLASSFSVFAFDDGKKNMFCRRQLCCRRGVQGKKRMQRNRATMSSSYSTTHFHPSILMHTNEMMIWIAKQARKHYQQKEETTSYTINVC